MLFAFCDNMKWAHLPLAGGIYDQDPDLVEKFRYIFAMRNQKMAKEQEEQQRKMEANKPKPVRGGVRRPRR